MSPPAECITQRASSSSATATEHIDKPKGDTAKGNITTTITSSEPTVSLSSVTTTNTATDKFQFNFVKKSNHTSNQHIGPRSEFEASAKANSPPPEKRTETSRPDKRTVKQVKLEKKLRKSVKKNNSQSEKEFHDEEITNSTAEDNEVSKRRTARELIAKFGKFCARRASSFKAGNRASYAFTKSNLNSLSTQSDSKRGGLISWLNVAERYEAAREHRKYGTVLPVNTDSAAAHLPVRYRSTDCL